MASLVGTYQHFKNENLDAYVTSLEVPAEVQKRLHAATPKLEIHQGEDGKWIIREVTPERTSEWVFTFGEEFEEMKSNSVTLKHMASMEGSNSIVMTTKSPRSTIIKKYEYQDNQIILTMTHENSGATAKRYFKRV